MIAPKQRDEPNGRSDPGLQTEEVTVLKFEGQQMRWRRKFKIWLDDVR